MRSSNGGLVCSALAFLALLASSPAGAISRVEDERGWRSPEACGDGDFRGSWVASLHPDGDPSSTICFAALVDRQNLVTTADCADAVSSAGDSVHARLGGGGGRGEGGERLPVSSTASRRIDGQLGLLRLSRPADLASAHASPLCVLPPAIHDQEGPFLHSLAGSRVCDDPAEGVFCVDERAVEGSPCGAGLPLALRGNIYRGFEESRFFLAGLALPGACLNGGFRAFVDVRPAAARAAIADAVLLLAAQDQEVAQKVEEDEGDNGLHSYSADVPAKTDLSKEYSKEEEEDEEEGTSEVGTPVEEDLPGSLPSGGGVGVRKSGGGGGGGGGGIAFPRSESEEGEEFGEDEKAATSTTATTTTTTTTTTTAVAEDEVDGDRIAAEQPADDDEEEVEQEVSTGPCITKSGEQCQFPYRTSTRGELQYTCTREPFDPDSFDSFCPTRVDPRTRTPLEWGECCSTCGISCPLTRYHTHRELLTELGQLVEEHPDHAEPFTVGTSNRGNVLLGIRISRDVAATGGGTRRGEEFSLRPRVKLIGNMHGNEPVGRELLLYFARYLLESDARGGDPRASDLLDTTDLYILPTMNPDGFARGEEGKCSGGSYRSGRLNEGRKDLNRDFPDFREWSKLENSPGYTRDDLFRRRQSETRDLMQWILDGRFVLSANFHDGAVLVNYPWDNYHDRVRNSDNGGQSSGVFKTPDHDEFYMLATSYSLSHATMENTTAACEQWGHFPDGVTNGADWYPVFGGMQDFNYLFAGTMEVTVEVSCCKYPHARRLLREWEYNRDSLFEYVEQAQKGIKGVVVDSATGDPVDGAKIRVRKARRGGRRQENEEGWRERPVTSGKDGTYWKILVPGAYEVQAFAEEAVDPTGARSKARRTTAESEVVRVVVRDEKRPKRIDLELRRTGNLGGDGDVLEQAPTRFAPAARPGPLSGADGDGRRKVPFPRRPPSAAPLKEEDEDIPVASSAKVVKNKRTGVVFGG